MSFHKAHLAGRVLHGEQAREELELHKRVNHLGSPMMHVPENYAVQANDVQTAVSVVYVTLAQTFSGPASLSTITEASTTAAASTPVQAAVSTDDITSAVASPPTAAATTAAITSTEATPTSSISLSPDESSYLAIQSAAQAVSTSSVSTGVLLATSSLALSTTATQLLSSPTAAAYATGTSTSALIAPSTAAASVSDSTTSTGGMSGAAKAGLVIALLVAIGMALGLAFFCWRRKKNPDEHREMLDEKHASFADASARSYESRHKQTTQAAMSQKVPSDVRATRTTSTAPRLSLRPASSFLPILGGAAASNANPLPQKDSAWERRPSATKQNPFESAAERQARSNSPPSNPFDESTGSGRTSPNASSEAGAIAGSAPPNAAQAPRGPNNVHRVQLDFKPSMEDELELRSGQLVRMLHEYDDGWALCVRMDRSQQGVVPRTCLSKLPVKPRPQGPPSNSRPGTSHSMESRPSMQSQRPNSPPQTYSRGPSPDLGNVPNRKPVPGQAM